MRIRFTCAIFWNFVKTVIFSVPNLQLVLTNSPVIQQFAFGVYGIRGREFPEKADIPIQVEPTDDIRSYHINSDKIKNVLGFAPKLSVEDAVVGLCQAFKAGLLPDSFNDDRYYNVRTMKKLGAR